MSQIEDKLLDPRECKFRLSAKMRGIVQRCLKKKPSDEDLKAKLEGLMEKEESDKEQLSYDGLTELHKLLQRLDDNYNFHFYQLMDECKLIPPEARKNKELENRLKQLRYQESTKMYKQMTSDITVKTTEITTIKQEASEIKPVLMALLNGLLVVGGTFAFFYKAVEYSMPRPDVAAQVLAGIIASTVVAIAELYFFVRIM